MINYALNIDIIGQVTDETFYQLCHSLTLEQKEKFPPISPNFVL